jgi:hypothetical protein
VSFVRRRFEHGLLINFGRQRLQIKKYILSQGTGYLAHEPILLCLFVRRRFEDGLLIKFGRQRLQIKKYILSQGTGYLAHEPILLCLLGLLAADLN